MSFIPPTKEDFSCGGLVWDKGRNAILLVKVENLSKEVVWTFPKGHPEKDETETHAALREVKEETGWDCRVVKSLIDVEYFFIHMGFRTHKTVRWFLMSPIGKTGEFNKGEILECEWVGPEEAKRRVVYDSDKKLLKHMGF